MGPQHPPVNFLPFSILFVGTVGPRSTGDFLYPVPPSLPVRYNWAKLGYKDRMGSHCSAGFFLAPFTTFGSSTSPEPYLQASKNKMLNISATKYCRGHDMTCWVLSIHHSHILKSLGKTGKPSVLRRTIKNCCSGAWAFFQWYLFYSRNKQLQLSHLIHKWIKLHQHLFWITSFICYKIRGSILLGICYHLSDWKMMSAKNTIKIIL